MNYEEINLSKVMNETINLPHLWAKDAPLLFVQQIILKTGLYNVLFPILKFIKTVFKLK